MEGYSKFVGLAIGYREVDSRSNLMLKFYIFILSEKSNWQLRLRLNTYNSSLVKLT
jgi:hypothetical protein